MTTPAPTRAYCLMVEGDDYPVETIPRDPFGSGALMAVNRAVVMSRGGGVPIDIYVGDRFLARYHRGRWVPHEPGRNGRRRGEAT
jgi:hypothetical protein